MIEINFAEEFAAEWIDSWNEHDLERILSHYSEDIEMSSPMIPKIAGEPSGRLKGKESLAAYWGKALQMIPDLKFELVEVLTGVNSVTIYYQGVSGTAAEVFFFDDNKKVIRAFAHYSK